LIDVYTSPDRATMWGQVGANITFFQHLGMMEVLHSVVGMTRSSPALTFIQIFSRYMVVAMLNTNPQDIKDDSTFIPMMLAAWTLADFTRYVFNCFGIARDIAGSVKGLAVAMKMMKVKSVERADDPVFKIPFPLVWIRYSLFIVLYPTGVFGELMVMWMTRNSRLTMLSAAQPGTTSGFVVQILTFMLQSLGLLENIYWYYGTILIVYAAGLPVLYLTLLGARKKQLAGPPKTDRAKKTQ